MVTNAMDIFDHLNCNKKNYRIKNMKLYSAILIGLISILFISCATGNLSKNSSSIVESSADMVTIPRGSFNMGLNDGNLNERPEHEVYLDTFMIDKYEVSAKEFAEFLNDKGNPEENYFSHDKYSTIIGVTYVSGKAIETNQNPEKYIPRKGFENYPANNVSWLGAYAYCQWKGKRLPTEAEWEKAARGDDSRIYPWGNRTPDVTKARYNQKWEEKNLNVMVPVDALNEGASYYGVLNMSGNVWEWVNDWYRQNYCDFCDPDIEYDNTDVASRLTDLKGKPVISGKSGKNLQVPPKNNPGGPSLGSFKVLRGGSWYDSYGELIIRTTYRYWFYPEDRYLNTGFRCAK